MTYSDRLQQKYLRTQAHTLNVGASKVHHLMIRTLITMIQDKQDVPSCDWPDAPKTEDDILYSLWIFPPFKSVKNLLQTLN